jgi:exosome complex RNA-binding protein Rrp4
MIKEEYSHNEVLSNSKELEQVIDETTGCFVSLSYNGKVWYTTIGDTKVRVESDSLEGLVSSVVETICSRRERTARKTQKNKKYTFK